MVALKNVSLVAIVAALYALTGLLSGHLAIPPGFSSPVWPAAGIAVLAVSFYGPKAAIGVACGSFLVNVSISQQSLFAPSAAWLPAIIIACGAALQAFTGALLVRRSSAFNCNLSSNSQVITLALLAGPLSCLISASIGVITLWLHGVIDIGDITHNWVTWWVGDSIGVIISVPILLVINFRQRWNHSLLLRFSLPYAALLILTVTLFNSARDADSQRIESLFAERSQGLHQAITRHLNTLTKQEVLLAESLLTFEDYSADKFSRMSNTILQSSPGVQAMSWVRHVKQGERALIDAQLQSRGSIGISERNQGNLKAAQVRDEYYSVFYIHPLQGNKNALGFDIASNSKRLAAIERSINERKVTVTEPIHLVQDNNKKTLAFLLLAPVITDSGDIKGLVSGAYRANDIFNAALDGLQINNINISITDISNKNSQGVPLFNRGEKTESSNAWSKSLDFSGRVWEIHFSPSNTYLQSERNWAAWGVLTGGFLLVSLFGAFIITLINQNNQVALEVKEKTQALNNALKNSEMANKAKNQFLANMSHELRTPLNAIIGFTQRIKTKYSQDLNPQINDALDTVLRNGQHLLSLITEILDISKIEAGKMEISCQRIPVTPLLQEAVNTMASSAKAKSLSLALQSQPDIHLDVDKKRFLQVILNLLSNAVKFTDTGGITVDCTSTCENNVNGVAIKVSDTGRGIAENLLPKLFKPFEQLQDEDISTPGTGLGLVLSKKMMELHGGHITVESQVNKGTTVTLWFPSSPVSSMS